MSHYRFSRRASLDLNKIVAYTFESWGVRQADIYIDGLEKTVRNLAQNPKIGKSRDDLSDGLRMFLYQSHEVYYTEDDGGIIIVHVLHKSMNEFMHFDEKIDLS